MDTAKMDATLALLSPEEIPHALRFIEVMERGGSLKPREADEWRRRILARQRFLAVTDSQGASD